MHIDANTIITAVALLGAALAGVVSLPQDFFFNRRE